VDRGSGDPPVLHLATGARRHAAGGGQLPRGAPARGRRAALDPRAAARRPASRVLRGRRDRGPRVPAVLHHLAHHPAEHSAPRALHLAPRRWRALDARLHREPGGRARARRRADHRAGRRPGVPRRRDGRGARSAPGAGPAQHLPTHRERRRPRGGGPRPVRARVRPARDPAVADARGRARQRRAHGHPPRRRVRLHGGRNARAAGPLGWPPGVARGDGHRVGLGVGHAERRAGGQRRRACGRGAAPRACGAGARACARTRGARYLRGRRRAGGRPERVGHAGGRRIVHARGGDRWLRGGDRQPHQPRGERVGAALPRVLGGGRARRIGEYAVSLSACCDGRGRRSL
jgi:hypothetical protein